MLRVAELRHVDGKVRNILLETEKNGWHGKVEAGNIRSADPSELRLLRSPDEYVELPERQKTALRITDLLIQPCLITAVCISAVQWIPSKHMWIHRACSSS